MWIFKRCEFSCLIKNQCFSFSFSFYVLQSLCFAQQLEEVMILLSYYVINLNCNVCLSMLRFDTPQHLLVIWSLVVIFSLLDTRLSEIYQFHQTVNAIKSHRYGIGLEIIFIFVIKTSQRHEGTASIIHFTFSIKFKALWVMSELRERW